MAARYCFPPALPLTLGQSVAYTGAERCNTVGPMYEFVVRRSESHEGIYGVIGRISEYNVEILMRILIESLDSIYMVLSRRTHTCIHVRSRILGSRAG